MFQVVTTGSMACMCLPLPGLDFWWDDCRNVELIPDVDYALQFWAVSWTKAQSLEDKAPITFDYYAFACLDDKRHELVNAVPSAQLVHTPLAEKVLQF